MMFAFRPARVRALSFRLQYRFEIHKTSCHNWMSGLREKRLIVCVTVVVTNLLDRFNYIWAYVRGRKVSV